MNDKLGILKEISEVNIVRGELSREKKLLFLFSCLENKQEDYFLFM